MAIVIPYHIRNIRNRKNACQGSIRVALARRIFRSIRAMVFKHFIDTRQLAVRTSPRRGESVEPLHEGCSSISIMEADLRYTSLLAPPFLHRYKMTRQ